MTPDVNGKACNKVVRFLVQHPDRHITKISPNKKAGGDDMDRPLIMLELEKEVWRGEGGGIVWGGSPSWVCQASPLAHHSFASFALDHSYDRQSRVAAKGSACGTMLVDRYDSSASVDVLDFV